MTDTPKASVNTNNRDMAEELIDTALGESPELGATARLAQVHATLYVGDVLTAILRTIESLND